MSEINNFLKLNQNEIADIISNNFELNKVFSSHDFIEKFAKTFEADYIQMLVEYQNTGNAFLTVHSLIARYLSQNMNTFRIEKTDRSASENVFGSKDYIQWWRRI
ncbi:MAG: hypothetical protein ABR968_02740 [Bacteroidales bacterium]|jgi:hypothetical protein